MDAIDGKLNVPPSLEYQKQEVANIIYAFNMIVRDVKAKALKNLTPSLVCSYNKAVLHNLKLEEGVEPGVLRAHRVVVGRSYRGAPAEDCQYLLDRLCEWLGSPDFQPPDTMPESGEAVFAILKAIIAHLYLAWIHPFGDGNGRTARLLELHILLSAGVPSPAAHLLSNHYNQTRPEYYRQLSKASKSGGDILPFISYAVAGFVEGLHMQLEEIWDQQWDIVWENHINEIFGEVKNNFRKRQRKLALAVGRAREWVDMHSVPDLSTDLAREYVGKTIKTIKRDAEYLLENGVIAIKGNRIRANREAMLAFLP